MTEGTKTQIRIHIGHRPSGISFLESVFNVLIGFDSGQEGKDAGLARHWWHGVHRQTRPQGARRERGRSGDGAAVSEGLAVEPDRELRWVSKMAGVTISERVFRLSPEAAGTSLVQSQTYRGLGGQRGGRLTLTAISRIESAFEAINQAMKQRAETRQRSSG